MTLADLIEQYQASVRTANEATSQEARARDDLKRGLEACGAGSAEVEHKGWRWYASSLGIAWYDAADANPRVRCLGRACEIEVPPAPAGEAGPSGGGLDDHERP